MSPNTRRRSRVEEIADGFAKELRESGETLETMLHALREVRDEAEAKRHSVLPGNLRGLCGATVS